MTDIETSRPVADADLSLQPSDLSRQTSQEPTIKKRLGIRTARRERSTSPTSHSHSTQHPPPSEDAAREPRSRSPSPSRDSVKSPKSRPIRSRSVSPHPTDQPSASIDSTGPTAAPSSTEEPTVSPWKHQVEEVEKGTTPSGPSSEGETVASTSTST
jgi:hypothetical protein